MSSSVVGSVLGSVAGFSDETLNDLSDYFHGAPIGLHMTSADGAITRANLAELELLGYRDHADEYLGRDFAEFHADPEALQVVLDRLSAGEPVIAHEATLLRRDGSGQRVLLYVNARVEDGAFRGARCFTFPHPDDLRPDIAELAALTDQSVENRHVELTAEQRQELYRELLDFFENGPVGLHIVGGDGLIKHANKAELTTLGYDASAYLGVHIARFHAEQRVIDGMLETLVAGTPLVNFSATLFRKDGSRLPVLIYSNSRMREGSFLNTRCFTVPAPEAHAAGNRVERFSWPRNEDFGFSLPGREAAQQAQSPMTVALKYIASRKRPEESLGFLARTSQALGAARPLDALLREAAALCVPFLADFVSIDLVSGHLAHACSTSLEARAAAIVRELTAGGRGTLDPAADPVEVCLDTRAPGAVASPRAANLRELGIRSLIVAPLTIRGEPIGTVAVLREDAPSRRVFGAADRALAEEFARRISFAVEIDRLARRAN
jgi:PAS domain S-box-containing protein